MTVGPFRFRLRTQSSFDTGTALAISPIPDYHHHQGTSSLSVHNIRLHQEADESQGEFRFLF